MHGFGQAILKALHQMDDEACGSMDGYPIGLAWYGAHFRPECKRPPTETSWTRRLAELLPQFGFSTEAEVRYPGHQKLRCDNVVTLPDGKKVWLEIKGAWKEFWLRKSEWIYRSYLFHPLIPGLDSSKKHTAALDILKLELLHRPEADYVGFLLIGFDSTTAPMEPDAVELARLTGIDRLPWNRISDHWDDRYRAGCRVSAWLWHRPAAVV